MLLFLSFRVPPGQPLPQDGSLPVLETPASGEDCMEALGPIKVPACHEQSFISFPKPHEMRQGVGGTQVVSLEKGLQEEPGARL